MDQEEWTKLEGDFLQTLRNKGLGENSLKNYRIDLGVLRKFLLNKELLPLSVFNGQMANEFIDHLESQSSNSRRRRLQTARRFLDFLIDKKYLSSNPLIQRASAPKWLDIPRPADHKDIYFLWRELLSNRPSAQLNYTLRLRDLTLFSLIFLGGLKVSDLTNLSLEDFQEYSDEYRVLIKPKRKDPYSIPISYEFKPLYSRYITALYKLESSFPPFTLSSLFFNANQHRPIGAKLSMRGIELIFFQWEKEYDVKITPKSLRQAGIMRWIQLGESSSQIKNWLGLSKHYSLAPFKKFAKDLPPYDISLISLKRTWTS